MSESRVAKEEKGDPRKYKDYIRGRHLRRNCGSHGLAIGEARSPSVCPEPVLWFGGAQGQSVRFAICDFTICWLHGGADVSSSLVDRMKNEKQTDCIYIKY
jgi:hypothetical protein